MINVLLIWKIISSKLMNIMPIILDQVRLIMLHQKLKASNQQHFTTMESMIGILYPIRSNPSMICKDLKKKWSATWYIPVKNGKDVSYHNNDNYIYIYIFLDNVLILKLSNPSTRSCWSFNVHLNFKLILIKDPIGNKLNGFHGLSLVRKFSAATIGGLKFQLKMAVSCFIFNLTRNC